MIYVITLPTIPVPALLSVPSIKEAPTGPAKGPLRAKCSGARGEEVRHLGPAAFDLVWLTFNFMEYCAQLPLPFWPQLQVKCYLVPPSKCSPSERHAPGQHQASWSRIKDLRGE